MENAEPLANVLPGALPEPRGSVFGGLEELRGELERHGDVTTAVPNAPVPQKQQLLEWLLTFNEQDVLWVLASLKRKMPHLVAEESSNQTLAESSNLMHASYWSGSPRLATPEKRLIRQQLLKQSSQLALDARPIVQFSSHIYFCLEEEGQMHIDIIRIGNLSQRSEVSWTTQDATATAGRNYASNSGRLVFEPNCCALSVDVDLINNQVWDTTLEFVVMLKSENTINAALGRYLWQARVKILDDDCFPSNKYRNQIMANDVKSVLGFSLLFEFIKMMFRGSTMRNSFKIMTVDQLKNLNLIVALTISVYLVDVVLNFEEKSTSDVVFQDRKAALVLLVALTLVPFAILHILDHLKTKWAPDAGTLKRNLLRKFLNFSEASRAQLRDGDLVMVITRDAETLVASGYSAFLALVAAIGRLLLLLIYEIISPYIWDVPMSFSSLLPLLAFPVLMGTFIILRGRKTSRALAAKHASEMEMVTHVQQAAAVYRLIADYNRRPKYVAKFEETVDQFNNDEDVSSLVLANNAQCAPWLAVLFVSMFTIIGGIQVLDDKLSLGKFLTTLRIFQTIGDSWGTIYAVLLNMQIVIPTLERVVWFMNLPTDISQRRELNRKRRGDTITHWGHKRPLKAEGIPLDSLPIIVSKVRFSYEQSAQAISQMNQTGTMKISQGEFVALVGPRGQGKSTLLKILGGVILPDISEKDGNLFIPSHLRVLHVSMEPLFFRGTLLENLIFGVAPDDPDGRKERVVAICQRLGLPDNIQNLVDTDDREWIHVLTQTQRYLLSICRALVANYEVCCMHKPSLVFDELDSETILQVLRDFVTYKGIEQDASTSYLRRPRTCIVTVEKTVGVDLADRIFCVVNVADGIKEISSRDITPELVRAWYHQSWFTNR